MTYVDTLILSERPDAASLLLSFFLELSTKEHKLSNLFNANGYPKRFNGSYTQGNKTAKGENKAK